MNSVRLLFRLACVLSLITAFGARGQVPSTGTIEGRVQNAATGDYLQNARIMVKGTNLETLTDDAGAFQLTGVPAGLTTLRAFFTGLDEQELTLNVTPGGTAQQNVRLT